MSVIAPKVAAPREEQNEWSFVGIASELMKKSRKSEFHFMDGQGVCHSSYAIKQMLI